MVELLIMSFLISLILVAELELYALAHVAPESNIGGAVEVDAHGFRL